jgi:hypothetical protein
MIESLNNLPTATMAILICLFFVGLTWIGAIFIRPFFRLLVRSQPDLNSLLGNFVSMYGIFYGILMGLLAVSAYQNKVDVERAITIEGQGLVSLYRSLSVLPEGQGMPLQETLRDYVQYVIDEEWPVMRRGVHNPSDNKIINQFQQQLDAIEPVTAKQEILYAEAVGLFYQFLQNRALRLHSATSGIPPIMWYVVLLGAFVSIFLTWMLSMTLVAHLFLGGILSFFIGTMVSLILVLDRPLRGEHGISPEVFQLLLKFFNTLLGQPAV